MDVQTRRCRSCGEDFEARFILQWICNDCAAKNQAVQSQYERAEEEARQRRRMAACGLEGKRLGMTFDAFESKRQPEAFRVAKAFADDFPSCRALALIGQSGTGKTHLGCAIVRALFDQGESEARYVHLPTLSADLRMSNDWQSVATEKVVPLYAVPVLVLDDVGRERPSPSFPEMLDVLIDKRWVGGYPTVITANLTREELFGKWLSTAAASRFGSEATVVQMKDGDRRYRGG